MPQLDIITYENISIFIIVAVIIIYEVISFKILPTISFMEKLKEQKIFKYVILIFFVFCNNDIENKKDEKKDDNYNDKRIKISVIISYIRLTISVFFGISVTFAPVIWVIYMVITHI